MVNHFLYLVYRFTRMPGYSVHLDHDLHSARLIFRISIRKVCQQTKCTSFLLSRLRILHCKHTFISMLAPIPSHYSVDSFVTNRHRLFCSIQLVFDLPHCSSIAMANRYISNLIPPVEVTQSSSQIITRNFRIIISAVMLNIFSALLKPSHIQFIRMFDVVSRRSVLSSNCAVDIALTQSAVDNTWRQ
jgi:hypothetical protein